MTIDKLPKRATVAELANAIDRSEKVVRECIHARGLKRGKDNKYSTAPIIEEHIERQKRNTRSVDDNAELLPPTTWSDQYKAKQVEKLEVQIQELRGELVPMDEVRSTMSQHCDCVTHALNNWVETIAAEKRDPEILSWAESARDSALRGLQEKLNAL